MVRLAFPKRREVSVVPPSIKDIQIPTRKSSVLSYLTTNNKNISNLLCSWCAEAALHKQINSLIMYRFCCPRGPLIEPLACEWNRISRGYSSNRVPTGWRVRSSRQTCLLPALFSCPIRWPATLSAFPSAVSWAFPGSHTFHRLNLSVYYGFTECQYFTNTAPCTRATQ